MSRRPVLIGIAGGSGSGKTFLAEYVQTHVGKDKVAVLSMDQYFRSTVDSPYQSSDVNFDHPAHLDLKLMVQHLEALKAGDGVSVPGYDFETMTVHEDWQTLDPLPVVIVEGLFLLAEPIRSHFDLTCFLDVEADERFLGRMKRDINERGGSVESIVDRYQRFVRPSYRVFVEPTRGNADVIIDFTYRRQFFTLLLTHLVQDHVSGALDLLDIARSVLAEGYKTGLRPEEGAMPMTADIFELSRNFPTGAFLHRFASGSDQE